MSNERTRSGREVGRRAERVGTMNSSVTLVLLPGLDGTDVFLQPLLAALPASVRPVVITYPQVGGDGYPELLTLIRREVAGLGEFYVLGWSFAGPLALMLAEAEPERVRGVILSASFVRAPHAWMPWGRWALIGPVVWTWRAVRRLPLWLFRPRGDALRQAKTQTWRMLSAGLLARRLRTIAGVDAREALRCCRGPVLYLAASDDRIVPPHCFEEIARERPSVTLKTIPGRHLAMYHNPQPAVRAIVEFIAAGR